ncbi:hypothetical protein [Petrachloros mirabilis]
MAEHELEELLGGFAADTLTAEEKQRLYAAALQDQQLFNALADEQTLKELLADPAIRRRLLKALKDTATSSAGGSLPWLNWFRRPANVALAGGLTAAVFAVVLGTKVYQESLEQAAQSVATEDTAPVSPPISAPAASESSPPPIAAPTPKSPEEVTEVKESTTKESLSDKIAKRERPTPATLQVPKATDAPIAVEKQPREQDEARRQTTVPRTESDKASTSDAEYSDRKLATTQAPQTSERIDSPVREKALGSGTTASPGSARALFDGELGVRRDSGSIAQESEGAMKPLAEFPPQENKSERMVEQMPKLGRAKDEIIAMKPLGLRYSFIIRGVDGRDREVDKETAVKSARPVLLTVEVNQNSYVQIWETRESSTFLLLLPDKDSGETSSRIMPGQRRAIPMPTGTGTVTIRVSSSPLSLVTGQESVKLNRPSSYQIHETVTTQSETGLHNQAHYVVNTDTTRPAQLVVEIPLSR